MSILLKNIILNGGKKDIYIANEKIEKIDYRINRKTDEIIDGKGKKAIFSGLINAHTHAAMVLFQGYGDDLPLKKWLEKKIWPMEQKLTKDDVYWGTKLACLEMIKTGTTCFNDMYFAEDASVRAIEEMGLRAKIGLTLLDFLPMGSKENIERCWKIFKKQKFKTISFAIAPHSIYTVCSENLIWAKNFARDNNLILHIHLSETQKEVRDCQDRYKMRPVEYLDKIGLLNNNTILAHAIWLSDNEINILRKRKSSVVYNPCSNMKLASGAFPYKKLKAAGINICLGTDGSASNNNLDLFEEMKFGALLQKHKEENPTIAGAKEVIDWAVKNGNKALKLNGGEVKAGKLADLILVDLIQLCFVPGHSIISDLVYSCNGYCVADLICNGKILMRDKKVFDEKKIVKEAAKRAKQLASSNK